jgi:hypothetical protein
VRIDPDQARALPPGIREGFLDAFAGALHGVFLWGLGFTLVAFVLSWMLKEVPLRTTVHAPGAMAVAEPAPEVAAAR